MNTDNISQSDLDYLEENKLVGKHLIDNKSRIGNVKESDVKSTAIFFAVILHIALAVSLYLFNQQDIPETTNSIQASLLTTEELLQLQDTVIKNQHEASKKAAEVTSEPQESVESRVEQPQAQATETKADTPASQPEPEYVPSQEAQAVNEQFAEQQRQFDAALNDFTDTQVNEAINKFVEIERQKEIEQLEEQTKVEELKARELTSIIEDIETKKDKEIDEKNKIFEEIEAASTEKNINFGSDANNNKTQSKNSKVSVQNKQQSNTPSSTHGDSSSVNSLEVVQAQIRSHFTDPEDVKGIITNVTVTIDRSGNVSDVQAVGLSAQLNEAAMQAVRLSSPLAIDSEDSVLYPTFSFSLIGK